MCTQELVGHDLLKVQQTQKNLVVGGVTAKEFRKTDPPAPFLTVSS
jgi:hypothetical protein